MHFTSIVAVLAAASVAQASLTYNVTKALTKDNFNKYKCLDNKKVLKMLPTCLGQCETQANKKDGCAPDDFACHCVNYDVYSKLIEPCAFPPSLGGTGTCSLAELGQARTVVSDMCNFFNATLYADYDHCPQQLSKWKTYGIVHSEDVVVTH